MGRGGVLRFGKPSEAALPRTRIALTGEVKKQGGEGGKEGIDAQHGPARFIRTGTWIMGERRLSGEKGGTLTLDRRGIRANTVRGIGRGTTSKL